MLSMPPITERLAFVRPMPCRVGFSLGALAKASTGSPESAVSGGVGGALSGIGEGGSALAGEPSTDGPPDTSGAALPCPASASEAESTVDAGLASGVSVGAASVNGADDATSAREMVDTGACGEIVPIGPLTVPKGRM